MPEHLQGSGVRSQEPDAPHGPFYTPERIRELLGNGPDRPMSKSTYYKLLRTKLLRSSRMYPGGPRIHTQQQLDDYRDYLNGRGEIGKRLQAAAAA